MGEGSSRDGNESIETRITELEARVEKLSAGITYIWVFLIGVPLILVLLSLLLGSSGGSQLLDVLLIGVTVGTVAAGIFSLS